MDGLLILNKEKFISSHDAVNIVRKKLEMKKVGHTGTLDPMASGVLIICLGKATKISDFIMKSKKIYRAKVRLGILTDSYDITGEILREESVNKSLDEIKNAIKSFQGEIYQKPPLYSALKVKGKKLYEYARRGEEVEIKKRLINIYRLEILSFNGKDEFEILVSCSSGTYIRSLAFDIGEKLGSFGVLTELTRLENNGFSIEDGIDTKMLEEISKEDVAKRIIPMDKALSNLPKFTYPQNFYQKVLNGEKFQLDNNFMAHNALDYYRLYCKDQFIGLGKVQDEFGKKYMLVHKKLVRWDMKVVEIDLNYVAKEKSIIALGNFDGVHKGHRVLLKQTVKRAREKKLRACVLAFKEHSSNTYMANKKKIISSNDNKFKFFSEIGIDIVYLIAFDKTFMSLSPYNFLKNFLYDKLKVRGLVVGYDYTFGYKKAGDVDYLKEHSYIFNWLDIIDEQTWKGQTISSSLIRHLISEGEIKDANELLESEFTIEGKVIHNKGLGKKKGYPTANLQMNDNYIVPRFGVYDTDIVVDGVRYKAATSIGTNPTVEDDGLKIEAHILDFDKDIYGKEAQLIFLNFIREEKVFNSVDELFKQIEKDVEKVRQR